MTFDINLKFEINNYDNSHSFYHNLYSGKFSNFLQSNFCRSSQVIEVINFSKNTLDIELKLFKVDDILDRYIISTAVFYSPEHWTDIHSKESIFEILNSTYITDLQDGKAILLIDQSVEGYHTSWLWDWFHKKCNQYNISPSAIIYLTGNQQAEDQYNNWVNLNLNITSKLKIVPSISLSYYIYQTYQNNNLKINFNQLLSYKKNNLIKLFNCTNLRPRPQRVLNFLHLVKNNLISDGLISMSRAEDWKISDLEILNYNISANTLEESRKLLPLTINHKHQLKTDYVSHITRILDDVYENTWVSLITESSFFNYEESIFISEKTFKAIACMHPFIIVGSKHSLKYLKSLGYKTFEGFIDESYDECDDNHRFDAIIISLNKIKSIPDKLSWYESMKDILEHNQRLFLSIENKKQIEHIKIINHYREYFNQ